MRFSAESSDNVDRCGDVVDAEFEVVIADGSPSVRLVPAGADANADPAIAVDRVARALNDVATAASGGRFDADRHVTADMAAIADPGEGLLSNVTRIIDLLGLATPQGSGPSPSHRTARDAAAEKFARISPLAGTAGDAVDASELPRSAGRFSARFRQSSFREVDEDDDDADRVAVGLDPSDGDSGEGLRRAVYRAGMPSTATLGFGLSGTLGAATLMLLPLLGGLHPAQAATPGETGIVHTLADSDHPPISGVVDVQDPDAAPATIAHTGDVAASDMSIAVISTSDAIVPPEVTDPSPQILATTGAAESRGAAVADAVRSTEGGGGQAEAAAAPGYPEGGQPIDLADLVASTASPSGADVPTPEPILSEVAQSALPAIAPLEPALAVLPTAAAEVGGSASGTVATVTDVFAEHGSTVVDALSEPITAVIATVANVPSSIVVPVEEVIGLAAPGASAVTDAVGVLTEPIVATLVGTLPSVVSASLDDVAGTLAAVSDASIDLAASTSTAAVGAVEALSAMVETSTTAALPILDVHDGLIGPTIASLVDIATPVLPVVEAGPASIDELAEDAMQVVSAIVPGVDGMLGASTAPLADVLDTAIDSVHAILETVSPGNPASDPGLPATQGLDTDSAAAAPAVESTASTPATAVGAVGETLSSLVATPVAHLAHGLLG